MGEIFPRGVPCEVRAHRTAQTRTPFFEEKLAKRGLGSANGNRTRITALKGRCANRCTMAPHAFCRVSKIIRDLARINKTDFARPKFENGPGSSGDTSPQNHFPAFSQARLSPPVAFAECGDMRDVVVAVPGIERQILVDGHRAAFGVPKLTRDFCWRERTQEQDPARVQIFQ